ncbi:MAG: NUDIX domain-containing protein [Dermatophilaceae bacterium]
MNGRRPPADEHAAPSAAGATSPKRHTPTEGRTTDDYPGLPARGGTVRRSTGRVIPFDADDRALLLQGSEPDRPAWRFWFTIGGMADPGESLRQAAVRELREEAGIALDEADLGTACLESQIEFEWAGRHVVQDQTFFAVRLPPGARPELDGLDAVEKETTFGWAMCSEAELAADPASLATPELTRYVAVALATLRSREA